MPNQIASCNAVEPFFRTDNAAFNGKEEQVHDLIDDLMRFSRENGRQADYTIGYNVGAEFIRANDLVFENEERKVHGLINNLTRLNEQNKDLQDLIAELTHAKKENRKADFSENVAMQHTIDRIHELNPKIFRTPVYVFEVDDLETTLTLLDSTVKDQVSKINETTMYITHAYEVRSQFTKSAQDILQMLMRHIESIISKNR